MCTLVGKETDDHIIILNGFGCCKSVEDIEEIHPKISRENGWEEIFVGELHVTHMLPQWAGWLTSEEKSRLPEELSKKAEGFKAVIYYSFDEDLPTAKPIDALGEIEHKGKVIYFSDLGQIKAFKEYIESINRNPKDFKPYQKFLSAIPKAFIGKSDRKAVSKKAKKLIDMYGM